MSGCIQFLLDGEVQKVRVEDPNTTLLNYLRYEIARTGTKEGCAEGDCGACTVVLGELVAGSVRYRAVNACILFLATLDGKELLTVESLKSKDGGLHPVQKALVETHGSQCGFCTPGFVMSLYALYLKGKPSNKAEIEDALAGNLCRCTGYGPIIEAATRMFEIGADELPDMNAKKLSLQSVTRGVTLEIGGKSTLAGGKLQYYAPVTISALADLCAANTDAILLAGGTDVALWVTKQHRELSTVIYLGDVAELKEINDLADQIEIGAGASYSDVIDLLAVHYTGMGAVMRRIGSTQIRNSGTVGGNIANGSPIGDMPPLLIAAGAQICLRSGTQVRQMPLEDFFVSYGKQDIKPGEFLEKIILPKPAAGPSFAAYKISKRFDQDISALCAAFAVTFEGETISDIRLAFGGMAGTPKRAPQAEAALLGKAFDEATIKSAMAALEQDFSPLDDMRASARYRMQVAQNLLMKMYLEKLGGTNIHVFEAEATYAQ